MDKSSFKNLPREHQWIVADKYLTLLGGAITSRMGLLPIMAGLAATLLVIATFNEKLIHLDNIIRFVICILLLMIPLSLFFYNRDLKLAAIKNKEALEELTEKVTLNQDLLSKVSALLPDIFIYIFGSLTIILILSIWHLI